MCASSITIALVLSLTILLLVIALLSITGRTITKQKNELAELYGKLEDADTNYKALVKKHKKEIKELESKVNIASMVNLIADQVRQKVADEE